MLKMLDLFSGIGGFSIAAHMTNAIETVAFCEIEPYPQKVLHKNFPGIPIYSDVRQLTCTKLKEDGINVVDIISGGFPCQDLSSVGVQKGIEKGERSSLFREILRLAGELGPLYLLFENVTNLLGGDDGRWFSTFLNELAAIGYDAEWHCMRASSLGAPHHRDRIWILAYSNQVRWPLTGVKSYIKSRRDMGDNNWGDGCGGSGFFQSARQREIPRSFCGEPILRGRDDGFSTWMDQVACCGNAIVPYVAFPFFKAITMHETKESTK